MKITRKIVALLMALLMVFSIGAVSASAIDNANLGAPVFSATLVSENSTQAVIDFSLVSGNFASAEFTFTPQGNFKALEPDKNKTATVTFAKSDGLKNFLINNDVSCVSNAHTGRLAFATSTPIEGNMSLYRITFAKKSNVAVKTSDLKIVVTNCDAYLKTSDTENVTSKTQVSFSLIKIELDNYNLSMNYKQSKTLNVSTNYDKSKLQWTSSNEKVATVDQKGNVTTVGTGSAVIKVATEDGNSYAQCTVNSSYSTFQWIIVIVFFGWLWY